MNQLWKLPIILMITTFIAASALSLVNNKTKPIIEEQKRLALENSLKEVLPTAANGAIVPVYGEKGEEIEYYKGFSDPDTTQLVGYIIRTEGTGYSSTIVSMVGIDTSGVIQGVKILDQLETPGLGAKIQEVKYGEEKPWFQVQFSGKTVEQLAVDKDGGIINSITGATISSRAVTNSIKKGIELLDKKIGGFPKKEKPII